MNKPCDLCNQVVNIRYRIQYYNSDKWFLVCPKCWKKLSNNNPDYRYGGTWKARQKARKFNFQKIIYKIS